MRRFLYIASKNKGKIKEYKKLLSKINCELLLQPQEIEICEDGKDFKENSIKKAVAVSLNTKSYSIADDSGLCIDALNGLPGIYSSRFANNDFERINRVLSELKGIKNRRAFFIANTCLSSPEGKVICNFEGKCFGNILLEPRGKNGFGYDPIFEEEETQLTFAEMSNEMKDVYSHRGKAIAKIIPNLIEIYN